MVEQKQCCGTTCDKQKVADYIERLEKQNEIMRAGLHMMSKVRGSRHFFMLNAKSTLHDADQV